jgi:nucleotide-binding universal stress UspA family protein
MRDYTEIAESAAGRLRQAGLRASALAAQGDPAATIISIAEKSQADLIVLGTHGRTGLRRVLLGSVARNVMLHAHCSVLVVRSGIAHPATPTPVSAPEG